jgi:hypothetical protein
LLVPFRRGGFLLVLRHAHTARIDFGDQRLGRHRHCFGARRREVEGGDVEAALVGAVGGIGFSEALLESMPVPDPPPVIGGMTISGRRCW